ncbi:MULTISPECIES: homoserine dehydrogenase [unclassified Mesorhizobium]|uniref:NAD(P)H-dependent oxidoreductase n=1 Tax=unclassified Mesorhizobium TaxID=325217 RepID=UPI000F75A0B0|nr:MULTISPECIES: homoserine dehydrogenase [unclassified Mesorhizobium]AZO71026.1 homoserine dehydrogenase [Mesorhizobium sp. M1D.F.Ca.ET.043.01.1.1]RWA91227.1 MAG: homoserine dehydrogenase [Mesorhizobium sp.]TGP22855.1 homoserine dehydrogenase [Mesorhizobium sp. M1D.F.Ca.ET.231.01.1.1]TGP31254.1 homoserine dehydrogenase [Mesorhizobium sp. M1D.F.Ca.ET.234.01.1.1]TGS45555.1 homoserine dehydrogenase [Mesorhizobium sp. M1D.F.Ca.ET.184.01.1.1]
MSHPQFAAELLQRAEKQGPITIGLAGAGQMGTDIVVQVALMPGMRIGAISEVRPQAAIDAALLAGHDRSDIVQAPNAAAIDRAIEAGKIAVTEDLHALAAAGRIDVIIDATGNPNIGTLFALEVMKNGKHIVMLNVEADITIGRFLKEEARKAGVVYTGAAGDEPACTLEIIGFAKSLGFTIVAAGKGKNNPLKFDAVPADYEKEAAERNMNARMLVEFVDGSKTAIEMVAIANATGLVPDVPGMHGPTATLEELASVLCPREDGGVLHRKGVVDYSIGKGVAPGVFCIIETKHPRVLERMIDLKVGKGPYFTIFRPYHLTSLEVPLSAARAVVYKRADMEPLDHPVAEAVAVAKTNLGTGQSLGMIGENDYRGFAMTWEDARAKGALPLGLAERAKVVKPVKAGDFLTYENCVPDDSMVITQIRRRLDQSDGRFVPNAA